MGKENGKFQDRLKATSSQRTQRSAEGRREDLDHFQLTSRSDKPNLDHVSTGPPSARPCNGLLIWTRPRNPYEPKALPILTAPIFIHYQIL